MIFSGDPVEALHRNVLHGDQPAAQEVVELAEELVTLSILLDEDFIDVSPGLQGLHDGASAEDDMVVGHFVGNNREYLVDR